MLKLIEQLEYNVANYVLTQFMNRKKFNNDCIAEKFIGTIYKKFV